MVVSLYKQYSDMLQYMSEKREKEGKLMTSYNFLLLKEWMLLVPRIQVLILSVSYARNNGTS